MKRHIACVGVVVRDYDEAKRWYCDMLGFRVVEDLPKEDGNRWVLLVPPGGDTSIVLQIANAPERETRVGNQNGGRVFLFLHTDDFDREYTEFKRRGVHFLEDPRKEPYGTVAKFEDLYGNR